MEGHSLGVGSGGEINRNVECGRGWFGNGEWRGNE